LPDGQQVEIRAEGILSICLQHEMDHLEGVLFIDRVVEALEAVEVEADIRGYEEDPAVRKMERRLKPVDARKLNLDFL
jgi:peptide deformylase